MVLSSWVCTDVERGGLRKCCSSALLFSSVAGTGRGIRPVGGSERIGHPHVRFSAWGVVLICSSDGPLALSFLEGDEGVNQSEVIRVVGCSMLLLL